MKGGLTEEEVRTIQNGRMKKTLRCLKDPYTLGLFLVSLKCHISVYVYLYIYSLTEGMLLGLTLRAIDYLIKTPHLKSTFRLLVRGVQETHKMIQAIDIVYGCLQETESKTLLLKAPWTLTTELQRGKLGRLWKPPPGRHGCMWRFVWNQQNFWILSMMKHFNDGVLEGIHCWRMKAWSSPAYFLQPEVSFPFWTEIYLGSTEISVWCSQRIRGDFWECSDVVSLQEIASRFLLSKENEADIYR